MNRPCPPFKICFLPQGTRALITRVLITRAPIAPAWLALVLLALVSMPAIAQTTHAAPSIEAIRLTNAGDPAAAIPLFEESFSRSFSWILADKAATAYADAGEQERGERFFRTIAGLGDVPPAADRATEHDPAPAPILFAIARIHAGTERALDTFETSLRRDPAHCLVWRRYIDDANAQSLSARVRAFIDTAAPSPELTFARGHLARREGDFEASRALLEEALAAGADSGWVIASLGAVYMSLGEWERAIDSYGASLPVIAARDDIELAALVQASRGYAAMRLGRYEDAFGFFREAVKGTGATGLYRLEIQYAAAASECAIRLGRYEEANEWTDAARQRARELESEALEYYAIGTWADFMIRTGEFGAVARELEPLAIANPDDRTPGMLRLLLHLARAKKSAGDLAGATRWYEELAARSARDALLRAAAHEGLSETHLLQGMAREAEREQRDAIAIYREAGDPAAALQAEADLARVFESQGRYQEALDALFKILPEERATGNAGRLSVRLSGIANLYDFLGNYREALHYRTEALEAVEQTGDSLGMAQERANLGLLQLKAGSYAEADSNLERSLRAVRSLGHTQTEGHIETYRAELDLERGDYNGARAHLVRAETLARESGNATALRDAQFLMGRALSEAGEHDEAARTLEAARDLASAQGDRYGEWLASYRLGEVLRAAGNHERSLAAFLQSFRASGTSREDLATDYDRVTFQRLRMDALDGALSILVEAERIEEAFLLLEEGRAQALAEEIGAGQRLTLADLQAALPAGTVLLSYWLSNPASHLWIVTPGAPMRYAALPSADEIDDRALFLNRRVRARESWAPAAAGLSEWLVGPAASALVNANRLIVLPDGALHQVPFDLLSIEGKPLIEQLSIAFAPSATVWAAIRSAERHENPIPFAGFGASETPLDRPPLPHAAREVRAIAAMFARGSSPYVRTGREATRDAVFSNEARAARYLHFATHAEIMPAAPQQSAILLAAGGDDPRRGRLTLEELKTGAWSAELVVLSGCETALGESAHGEGMVGFARTFLRGGARGVVASLWQVSDESTADLMQAFYASILSGNPPREALRNAKMEWITSREGREQPYYWAPFIYIGE